MNTLVITKFDGRLTRYSDGDINSGYAKYSTSHGYNPFVKPGNLTWMEQPSIIGEYLPTVAKVRVESNIVYTYVVDTDKNLRKIQVNDIGSQNPNYDSSSIITKFVASALGGNPPTFQYGPSMQFYGTSVLGASQKIFVGHDAGVTKVNFDGSSETVVTTLASSSIITNVPRPSAQFLGKTYWGNANNLIEIDSTETVTSHAKLSPGFPPGTYVRDMDVTPDGNYLQIIVSRLNPQILNTTTQDTVSLSSSDSYKFLWNGVDDGPTAYETYTGYSINSNTVFGQFNYTAGYDSDGTALYSGNKKIESLPNSISPNFAAMFSTGNMVGFASPEYDQPGSVLTGSLMLYGQYDQSQQAGLYRFLKLTANNNYDIISVPICLPVSNLFYGATDSGYSNNIVGVAKVYFSTFEIDNNSNNRSRLYKFTTVPIGLGSVLGGVYETQTQLFSKKVTVSEVRVYGEPWVTDNAFKVDLIGSNGNPITSGSYTFTVGDNINSGDDYAWYNPNISPTYALGLRITNVGVKNNVINKVEIDVNDSGK